MSSSARRFGLLAVALAFEAAAQAPDMTVTTREGEGVLWMGDCVRTKDQRGKPGDPCPVIIDYVRDRTKRSDINPALRYPKEDRSILRDQHAVIVWPPTGSPEDRVKDQWPRPADFKAGWSIKNPVVLWLEPTAPQKPDIAPELEGRTLADALIQLVHSPWQPVAKRTDGAPINIHSPTAEEREGRVLAQRPRPNEPATGKALDLYVLVPASKPPTRLVTRLIGFESQEAERRASHEGFTAIPGTVKPQPEGRVEYQSPRPGAEAPPGSVIEYLVARSRDQCTNGERCRLPAPGPYILEKPGERVIDYIPVPQPYPVPVKEFVYLTLAASGTGALGAYAVTRVIRRRSRDEDVEGPSDGSVASTLNARVRADRYGTQEVLAFSVRRTEPTEPTGGTP